MIEKIKKRKDRPGHERDHSKVYRSCARKKRYRTPGDAMEGIRHAKQIRKCDYLDYYFCSFCNGYHLTSREGYKYDSKRASRSDKRTDTRS